MPSLTIDNSDPGASVLTNAQNSDPSDSSSLIVSAFVSTPVVHLNLEDPNQTTTINYVLPQTVDTVEPEDINALPNLTFDTSDSQDYGTRFFMSDNLLSEDQPSDIAFFNIINASDYSQIIFPSKQFSLSYPGISKEKFRQFIITGFGHAQNERFQLYENNIDYTLNFFQGQKPEILQISGILKNTRENPWDNNMLLLWDNLIRGGRLAELGLIMRLYVDGTTYLGYPIAFNKNKQAGTDFLVNFSMGFIIRKKILSADKNKQLYLLDGTIKGITNKITKNVTFADTVQITISPSNT